MFNVHTNYSFWVFFFFHLENNNLATVPPEIYCCVAREYRELLICFDAFPCMMIDFYIFEYLTQLCRKHIWHSECLYGWRCQSIRCLWAICPCGPADGWSSAAAPKRINASSRPARRLLHEKHWRYFNQSKMRFWKPHGAKQCRTSVFVSPKQVCQQLHMQNFHLRVHRFCVSFTFSTHGSVWFLLNSSTAQRHDIEFEFIRMQRSCALAPRSEMWQVLQVSEGDRVSVYRQRSQPGSERESVFMTRILLI